jgi:hypothetical protein
MKFICFGPILELFWILCKNLLWMFSNTISRILNTLHEYNLIFTAHNSHTLDGRVIVCGGIVINIEEGTCFTHKVYNDVLYLLCKLYTYCTCM